MISGQDLSNGLDVSPEEEPVMCEEEGCDQIGMPCFLPGEDEPEEFFCPEHTHKHGYCWGCGNFWSGVESFDFNLWGNELCDNCKDNPDLTGDWHEDEDEEDYDEIPF
jgi:hypothetical protein